MTTRSLCSLYSFTQYGCNLNSLHQENYILYTRSEFLWYFAMIFSLSLFLFWYAFPWTKSLPKIISASQHRGKVCVHPIFPRPHFWNYIRYVIIVVFVYTRLKLSFMCVYSRYEPPSLLLMFSLYSMKSIFLCLFPYIPWNQSRCVQGG